MTSHDSDLKITLNRDIVDFAAKYKLSQRETDVFLLLLNRISTSSDIAEFLGLSANTVSNHLKSILTKSRCHSKTELLGQFLEFQLERTQSLHAFVRRPRVMVVAHDETRANELAEALQHRGLEAFTGLPSTAGAQVVTHRAESVVFICNPSIEDALRFFEESRSRFLVNPNTFPVTPIDLKELDPNVFPAVTEVIPAYMSPDQIALAIVEHGIPDPYIRNRFVRTDSNFAATINGEVMGTAENIGHGGLFVSFADVPSPDDTMMKKNKGLEIAFTLPDGESYTIPSRVAWVRAQPKTFLRAGIGVQFLEMSLEISQKIKEFVRQHKKLPRL